MRFKNHLACLMLAMAFTSATGCGSGGGNTTGTLNLSVTPSTAGMKTVVTAVAAYSSPTGSGQGLDIDFSTNHPELFAGGSAKITSDGTATFTLTPSLAAATAPTVPTQVTVTASTGDLRKTSTFILKPATMQITPPPTTAFPVGDAPVGSVFRMVPSGMFVTVTDGLGNPVPAGTPVTITVNNVVNGTVSDVLFWNVFPNGTSTNTITETTDSTGRVPMFVTIDIVVPSSKTAAETVNWRVTFPDPDTGATIVGYATTMLSITP